MHKESAKSFALVVGLLLMSTLSALAGDGGAAVWTEYSNDDFGFALRHPLDWQASVSKGTSPSVIIGKIRHGNEPQESMQFFVQRNQNPQGLGVRQWADAQLKKMKVSSTVLKDTVIGGEPAVQMENAGTNGKHYNWYVARNKVDVFTVAVADGPHSAEMLPLYNLVLSTLNFLPKKKPI